jgi:serine/threonine protein kinase
VRQPIAFGKYALLERISVGGMAEVFKAKSFGVEGLEKILAIKRILPSMAEDQEFIEMFIDEAKICGQLNHANICQIFELGRVGDDHFIAMEFIWGKDLLQIQNRFRKLRVRIFPEMAAYIVAKLCQGLDYAHRKKDAAGRPLGIIHRDISPQNILVSYEGEVKIIDFGIAKAATRGSRTRAGVLKGKFGYMSPEQVRGLPLDHRSDLFAIGTILYELLISDRLFYGDSDFETLEKVRNVDVAPPSSVRLDVPLTLEKIIMKALARDVDERYQWASEMQDDLETFVASVFPRFATKQLSAWMREQFAVEMKRERQVLDEQRQIGTELLREASAEELDALVEESTEGEDPLGEETAVGPPEFDASSSEPPPLAQASTKIFAASTPPTEDGADDLPAQPTALFADAGARRLPSARSSTAPQPRAVTAPPMAFSLVPFPQGRSTVGKDIFIGIGLATVLVAAVLGVRAYVAKGAAPPPVTQGTMVVVSPSQAAEVVIDGVPKGRVEVGVPFTLKDVPQGAHEVKLRSDKGVEFQKSVTLSAGDVSVVTASFPVSGYGTGQLKLNTNVDDAEVYVDGALLAKEAIRSAISLRADVVHEILVKKLGMVEAKLPVELKAGEVLEQRVTLERADDPAGAPAEVKSQRVGQTWVSASEFGRERPEKRVRGTARHSDASVEKSSPSDAERTQPEKRLADKNAETDVATTSAKSRQSVPSERAEPVNPDSQKDAKSTAPGFLVANTQPWAKVFVDGQDTGKTTPIAPRSKIPLKPGPHKVTFLANGRRYSYDINVKSAEDTRLIKQLSESD